MTTFEKVLVILIVGVLFVIGMNIGTKTYQPLIDACELELPRKQKCVLVAVPEPIK